MYDTVIIGAGMSGLAAGIRLAYFDQKVCILERHTTIGGLNSFYRLDGRNHDVGLHAVTNFTAKGAKRGPLARLLRQLRFRWDEFSLAPQIGSAICFPGVTLNFSNDFALLESEIERAFPGELDNLHRLMEHLIDYDDVIRIPPSNSAREMLRMYLREPLLAEMLLCPLMFYGNAREHDMDFGQFCIMFRSIFLEGLARPMAGVRLILKKMTKKFKSLGGELRLRAGVKRLVVEDGRVASIELDDGTHVAARQVLSSAGWVETMRLCTDDRPIERPTGQMSVVESISILDCQPAELDHHHAIVFFNTSDAFRWECPDHLVDCGSGVICSPNNFQYETPLDEGCIRVTCTANYDRWNALPEEEYQREKLHWYDEVVGTAVGFVPDYRSNVVATDMFTPTTIRRFTGHDNGAMYGSPDKQLDGTTHLSNLFVCGNDQGWVGVVGAAISGISMANQHVLK